METMQIMHCQFCCLMVMDFSSFLNLDINIRNCRIKNFKRSRGIRTANLRTASVKRSCKRILSAPLL